MQTNGALRKLHRSRHSTIAISRHTKNASWWLTRPATHIFLGFRCLRYKIRLGAKLETRNTEKNMTLVGRGKTYRFFQNAATWQLETSWKHVISGMNTFCHRSTAARFDCPVLLCDKPLDKRLTYSRRDQNLLWMFLARKWICLSINWLVFIKLQRKSKKRSCRTSLSQQLVSFASTRHLKQESFLLVLTSRRSVKATWGGLRATSFWGGNFKGEGMCGTLK